MRWSLLLLLIGCVRNFSWSELSSCPAYMDEEQKKSGYVRCTAMCSSYGRDVYEFDSECKCRCMPEGRVTSPNRPAQKPPINQM